MTGWDGSQRVSYREARPAQLEWRKEWKQQQQIGHPEQRGAQPWL